MFESCASVVIMCSVKLFPWHKPDKRAWQFNGSRRCTYTWVREKRQHWVTSVIKQIGVK